MLLFKFVTISFLSKKSDSKFLFRSIFLVNYKVFLFSDNGYLFSYDYKNGSVKSIHKILKKGLDSDPIFSDGFMFVVDGKKKLLKFE